MVKNKLSMLFLLSSLCLSANLPAAQLPESLDLVYRANVAGMNIGTLNRQLRTASAGVYSVTSETNATGIAAVLMNDTYREKSEFKIEKGMTYPLQYYQAPDKKPEKTRKM